MKVYYILRLLYLSALASNRRTRMLHYYNYYSLLHSSYNLALSHYLKSYIEFLAYYYSLRLYY